MLLANEVETWGGGASEGAIYSVTGTFRRASLASRGSPHMASTMPSSGKVSIVDGSGRSGLTMGINQLQIYAAGGGIMNRAHDLGGKINWRADRGVSVDSRPNAREPLRWRHSTPIALNNSIPHEKPKLSFLLPIGVPVVTSMAPQTEEPSGR